MQQITIKSWKEVKSGNTNGKEWVLYEVLDYEGKKYSTFGSVLNAANVKVGESYLVSTETRKNGKWTNVFIKEIYRAKTEEKPENSPNLANIEARLRAVEAVVFPNEIKKEDLPF